MSLKRLSALPSAAAIYSSTLMLFLISGGTSWSAEINEKQPTASISIGTEFNSGSYNTDSTIRSLYSPLIISYYPTERFDMNIELPFVYQSSSQVITTSLGQTATGTVIVRGNGRGGMITTGGGTTTTSSSSSSSSDVSGLGDIILRAGYIQLFESSAIPQIRTSLFVKAPTASVSDGLGTGEFDFGGGFNLYKEFGDLRLSGEALYTYQGKVSGFGLKNYLSYTGTVGYQATDSIQPMLVVKGATAPSTYSDDLLEVRGRLLWNITKTTALDLFASRGISKSSPDYGGGFAVIYSF